VERGEGQNAARRQAGTRPDDDRVGHAEVRDHDVRATQRPVVRFLAIGHHEGHVGEARPAGQALGLDERAGVGVDPEDAASAWGEVEREASGPRPDIEDSPTLEGLLVEPRE
jgi:hypothetical protein